LLSASQRARFSVVLVSPRNPLNIGAAARAMANFGFSRLSVVAPYEPHWREAKSAVLAESLLKKAKRVERLADAVADCTLVLGTGTLTHRKPEQPVVSLPHLANLLQNQKKIAIVFGPEKRGLTRQDLSLCHFLVEIPTHPRQPSMNLAQAVAVCLYELTRGSAPTAPNPSQSGVPQVPILGPGTARTSAHSPQPEIDIGQSETSPPATAADLDLLAGVIEQTLAAANYSPPAMRNVNRHHLHLLLRRLSINRRDARRIVGVFRRILWRFEHHSGTL
jgi:TrmH family RNA methyltransferase